MKERRRQERTFATPDITAHIEQIVDKKSEILDMWDCDKKTIKYGNLKLSFRTTKKIAIRNQAALLEDIIKRTSIREAANQYISGFKLTPVKAYMSVHPFPPTIAELVESTSVTLIEENK